MKTLKRLTYAIAAVVMTVTFVGCHEIEEFDNNGRGNFEQLWTLFDEHYCFFKEKGVDWDSVYAEYAPKAADCKSYEQLFGVCSDMLAELKDGHVNLSSWFNTFYYRDWWSAYPQNFNERVIEQNYLSFDYRQLGPVIFDVLQQNIGYMRIDNFESGLGDSNMTAILNHMAMCNGLIIDVRDNGGGSMTNVETVVSRFIKRKTLVGYIMHKTGPGHDDFSEPYAYYYAPPDGALVWSKPVAVLCNRSTFSAANNFVSVMKLLPNVTVIGATTGGGSGMPMSYELACGWGVRMSASPVLDAEGNGTEFGVDPTDGFEVGITAMDTAAGRDPIIDKAVALLSGLLTGVE